MNDFLFYNTSLEPTCNMTEAMTHTVVYNYSQSQSMIRLKVSLPELCSLCTPPLLSTMDLVWIVGFVVSVCAWFSSAERHSVYWNSTNPKFLKDDYTVEVKLNDYLDIVCPHYPEGEVPLLDAERYVLYMVEREDFDICKPQSYDQMRWECGHPFAPHAAEKFSEKFQRFTPFTLGKEFRQGESYYYISKPLHHHGKECLRLKVDVVAVDGSQEARVAKGGTEECTVKLCSDGFLPLDPLTARTTMKTVRGDETTDSKRQFSVPSAGHWQRPLKLVKYRLECTSMC
ncbi:hypothetical protein F7725_025259 [Dissostichus mawsoni]|uniref:Ephrin-A1 n=1 Tax=Dissostichus mawsoni TaxID=36200 RepID=A0A7J5XAM5_DISMA|nr:hypothetical protein F7725_025259 [Dissostichus mawsoni]